MAATNPGRVSLIAWWSLDEASGDAIDAWRANDLTETGGTIASATGIVGNARNFELGDTEWFSITDNTDLSMGDIAFTIGCWVKLESQTANMAIMAKFLTTGNQREYRLSYVTATDDFSFNVSVDGTATGESTALSDFDVLNDTWYFLIAYHDPTANTIGISVNAGTAVTDAHTTGVFDGTAPFTIGALPFPEQYFDGLIDEAFVYKRILTQDEIDWLYNSGAGRAQSELAELKTVSGAVTPAGTVVKKAIKSLSGALASSGEIVKSRLKAFAGAIEPSGVVVKKTLKVLAGAITPSGVVSALFLLFMRFFAQPEDWTFAAQQDEDWAYEALPENWAFKVKDDTNG